MIDLLPPKAKERRHLLYRMRVALISVMLLALIALSSVVVLSSFLLVLEAEEGTLVRDGGENDSSKELKEGEETLNRLAEQLQILELDRRHVLPTEGIDIVLRNKNVGIVVQDLAYTTSLDDDVKITTQGVATTREALLNFLAAIEAEEMVSMVESPISNLSSSRDILFTATFMVHRN